MALKKRKLANQETADDIYKKYLSVRSHASASAIQEGKGLISALIRNLVCGRGQLNSPEGIERIIDDVHFPTQAWFTWYSELSSFFAEHGQEHVAKMSEHGLRVIKAMAERCDRMSNPQLFAVVEKSNIFVQVFPCHSDLIRRKVLSGRLPATERMLEHFGLLETLNDKTCQDIRPFDLKTVVTLLNIGRKKLHAAVPDMIMEIASYGRVLLQDGSRTLGEVLSCGLPVSVITQIRKKCIGPQVIRESTFHQALLESTVADSRLRTESLKYFIGTASLSDKIRLQVKTVFPDDLFGEKLCQMLIFIGECIVNHDMLDGIPDSATFQTRAVDVLLDGGAGGQELFKQAQGCVDRITGGGELMRFVA